MPSAEQPPTTREIDWAAMVRKAWGKDWTKPDTAYEFTNRKFDAPQDGGGIYNQDDA